MRRVPNYRRREKWNTLRVSFWKPDQWRVSLTRFLLFIVYVIILLISIIFAICKIVVNKN